MREKDVRPNTSNHQDTKNGYIKLCLINIYFSTELDREREKKILKLKVEKCI